MRFAVRALLLATGCAVMLATAPEPPPPENGLDMFLPKGSSQVVALSVKRTDKKQEDIQPEVLLRANPYAEQREPIPSAPRLVGLVSTSGPSYENLPRLKPEATFTPGQQVEGIGTVAFVLVAPGEKTFGGEGSEPPLPYFQGAGKVFLTLFSPDTFLEAHVRLALDSMEKRCGCELEIETYPSSNYHPPPVDAGLDGGTDGGDGG
jgi:hypothetical protein